jgi:signal transduction histidine kinase
MNSHKQKILVIDDLPDNVYTLKEILTTENFDVVSAMDGESGIKAAVNEMPDMIICDIMMPKMNGFEVMNSLKNNPKTATIPFIFLSAKSEIKDIREGMKIGADDYITKPFDHRELLNVIKVRLKKKELFEKKIEDLRQSISFAIPHELKTPLMSILGFSQILMEDFKSLKKIEVYDFAEKIHSAGERLNSLIQKVLLTINLEFISKDPQQQQSFVNGFTDHISEFISTTAFEMADEIDRTKDLIIEIGTAQLKISSQNFKHVLIELLDNAFKFSNKGDTVRIVGLINQDKYNLYIIDHGLGMSEEQIANIGGYFQFNRFVHEQPGIGLGLTIVKRIVELHKGDFSIESIPGKKTLAKVSLPLV